MRATRDLLGPEGRIRVDANGGWNVDEAERAAHALAPFDLEYLEQPCATVAELVELRERLRDWQLPIAADESVRKADDPLEVARDGPPISSSSRRRRSAACAAALRIVADAGLPAVVSSALDTSVGLAMGVELAAALPELEFDCGLGTAALLAADVTRANRCCPRDGFVEVRRVEPDPVACSTATPRAPSAPRGGWSAWPAATGCWRRRSGGSRHARCAGYSTDGWALRATRPTVDAAGCRRDG